MKNTPPIHGIADPVESYKKGGFDATLPEFPHPNFAGMDTIAAMDYLLKTEPSVYSFANLEKEKSTLWDGVTNPVAVKNLRGMKPGDRLVIYHTGDEKSAVGTGAVESVEIADAKTPQVRIRAGKAIAQPKTLAEIKAHKVFADSPLVRQGRLSVVPLTAAQWKYLVGE